MTDNETKVAGGAVAMAMPPVEPMLPEAPASVNFRLVSPSGTWVQWTLRDNKASALLAKFQTLDAKLRADGWTSPPAREQGGGKVASDGGAAVEESKMCEIHNVPMQKRSNDKGEWWSHKTEDPRYVGSKGYCRGQEPKTFAQ